MAYPEDASQFQQQYGLDRSNFDAYKKMYSQNNRQQPFGGNMPTFGGNMPSFGGNAPQQNSLLPQMNYNQRGEGQFEQGQGLRGRELEERIRQFNEMQVNQNQSASPYEQSSGLNQGRFNEARSNFMNMFKNVNPFSSYNNYTPPREGPHWTDEEIDPTKRGSYWNNTPPKTWSGEPKPHYQGSQPSLEERALNQRASNPPAGNNWGY